MGTLSSDNLYVILQIPIISAYQKLVEKEMLSQEITEEIPEEEPIVLVKNTLRDKMNGIVIKPDVDLDQISVMSGFTEYPSEGFLGENDEKIELKKNTLRAKLDSIAMVQQDLDDASEIWEDELEEEPEEQPIVLKKNTLRAKMDSISMLKQDTD